MNSSKKNSWRVVARLCALGTLAGCLVARAFAQQSSDELFGRAVELFGQGKYEDACDLMTQAAEKRPSDQKHDYQKFQRQYCLQKKLLLDNEKKYFDEGMQFAGTGNCDDARQDYERINKIFTKDSKYRNQLSGAVSECENKRSDRAMLERAATELNGYKFAEARAILTPLIQKGGATGVEAQKQIATLEQTERSRTQEAKEFFAQGKDDDARARLVQVGADRGQPSNDAQSLLAQINQVEANERKSLDQAAALVKQGKNSEAQSLLAQIIARKGPLSVKAGSLLKQVAGAGEEFLRAGLKAYFHGNLEDAENKLTAYLNVSGKHDGLAYFFRGATRASRYFLSGESDVHLKNDAVEDFRTLKQRHRDFHVPSEYLSPKVFSLYQSAS